LLGVAALATGWLERLRAAGGHVSPLAWAAAPDSTSEFTFTDADGARALLLAAQAARDEAVLQLEIVHGALPPQVEVDLSAAQAAQEAGNWRAAEQLARLALDAIGPSVAAQRAAALARERLARGLLATTALALMLVGVLALARTNVLSTLGAACLGAAGLAAGLFWPNAGLRSGEGLLQLGPGALGAALAALAAYGSLALERVRGRLRALRLTFAAWAEALTAELWLALLTLAPVAVLFTLDGAWPAWWAPPAGRTTALERLLSALSGVGVVGAAAPALFVACLALGEQLWHTTRQALYSLSEATRAHRHHRQ